jgi:hypothetical protein
MSDRGIGTTFGPDANTEHFNHNPEGRNTWSQRPALWWDRLLPVAVSEAILPRMEDSQSTDQTGDPH